MTDQNGWITWTGGECPVPGNKAIEVLTQSSCVLFDYAKKFRWSHENMHGTHEPKASNVIAYRYRYRSNHDQAQQSPQNRAHHRRAGVFTGRAVANQYCRHNPRKLVPDR